MHARERRLGPRCGWECTPCSWYRLGRIGSLTLDSGTNGSGWAKDEARSTDPTSRLPCCPRVCARRRFARLLRQVSGSCAGAPAVHGDSARHWLLQSKPAVSRLGTWKAARLTASLPARTSGRPRSALSSKAAIVGSAQFRICPSAWPSPYGVPASLGWPSPRSTSRCQGHAVVPSGSAVRSRQYEKWAPAEKDGTGVEIGRAHV